MKTKLLFVFLLMSIFAWAQDEDAMFIKRIHDVTLRDGTCYQQLEELCAVGGRLAGSEAYEKAVQVSVEQMRRLGVDTVYLQECDAMGWVRGGEEIVRIVGQEDGRLRATSLGNSYGTGPKGVQAEVIEVLSLDEVDSLGKAEIEGKIVFYNRPMDPTNIRTFDAYGGAVDQRVWGAARAAKYGAVATIVRSMTNRIDTFPHTGTLVYREGIDTIASLAISTYDAERLSDLLKKEKVQLYIKNTCHPTEMKKNHSVIGEIRGSVYPEEIIVVGGHLDAWDIGHGAHDDGAGCVQSMQVLESLLALGYTPKRTIRCVLFANEENGLAGGRTYAQKAKECGENHIAALESDAGGFSPRGFSFDGHADILADKYRYVTDWLPLFESLGLQFKLGGSGADISPLKNHKTLLVGLRPDSQRYFDFHHTSIDLLEAVNERELKMGAAAMASLIYLFDKHGVHRKKM